MKSLVKLEAHLQAAKVYASLSQAKRLKVGAVILKDDRIISIGYNGTPSGRDNACEFEHEGNLVTKQEVCHSEMNAISFAAKYGVATKDCTLVVTHSPCFECAKMIIQSGIKEVCYELEYRDINSIDFLKECGIIVKKIKGDK